RDVVGDTKSFAVHGVDIPTFELIRRRKRDRVNEDVEAVPVLGQAVEERVDPRIVGHVERQHDARAELLRHALDAFRELLALMAEGKLRAFAPQCLRDTPGNRAIAGEADHDGPLTGQESHQLLCSVTSTWMTRRCPGCKYFSVDTPF